VSALNGIALLLMLALATNALLVVEPKSKPSKVTRSLIMLLAATRNAFVAGRKVKLSS
jgi:hypothetical protein